MNDNQTILHKICLLVLCAVIVSLLSACAGTPASSEIKTPADLGDGWQTASLEEVGFNSAKLAAMLEDIHDGGYENLHSLLIVKDGRLVFEEYFRGHNQTSLDDVASVTKSVTSIMVGIAIKQGFIKGADQYLTELLPSYADLLNADPLKQKLQLWHVLSMTSGFEWDEETYPYGDKRNDATAMERSTDAVRFVLDRPMAREPGAKFQYCGGNSMLLSAILEEATGMTVAEYAKLNLFEPLGISFYRWPPYADGHTNTDGGLSLRPRDMAKIGQLMLNQGVWNGVQLIPAEWVAESTQAHTKASLLNTYGYQWWRETQSILLESVKTYFAAGFGGQLINVYPDQNMVVVVTSDTSNHDVNSLRFMHLRDTYILPATIPALFSKLLLWGWYLLTTGGLVFLVLEIIRRQLRGFGWAVAWLLIGALFGPLGIAAYLLSYRNPATRQSTGWKALGMATFIVIGNMTSLILLTVFQPHFLLESSILVLVLPLAFLVDWLALLSPLVASTRAIRYWKAVLQTLLTAFFTSHLAFVGILPVVILLAIRWFLNGFDLTRPLFWFMMTIGGLAGVVLVYPLSFWLARRKRPFWPT
jgi:CubicO group peptidase (beta-lactamase class C family)